MYRYLLLLIVLLSGCVGSESGNPPLVEESTGGKPKEEISVCPSCIYTDVIGKTSDTASVICTSRPAELTEEIEREFGISELTAFLAEPYTVSSPWVSRKGVDEKLVSLPSESPVEIEFTFEVGEFEYLEPEQDGYLQCRLIRAPLQIHIRVGDDILTFSAEGSIYKVHSDIKARFYTVADLADASGSLRLEADEDTLHAGQVEINGYVYSDQIRGTVTPEIMFFADEDQAEIWRSGRWQSEDSMQGRPYEKLVALFSLEFPDDACDDQELPVASDEPAEFLRDKTPNALLSEAQAMIEDRLAIQARWHDGETTNVRLGLEDIRDATLCVSSYDWTIDPDDENLETRLQLELNGWPGARLTSDDGLIDIPIEIAVVTEVKTAELVELRSHVWIEDGEIVDETTQENEKQEVSLWYDLRSDDVPADGILFFYEELNRMKSPACLAWPIGGDWDEDCQNREPDKDAGESF